MLNIFRYASSILLEYFELTEWQILMANGKEFWIIRVFFYYYFQPHFLSFDQPPINFFVFIFKAQKWIHAAYLQ